ncbi:MAG TPA: GTPase Era [Pseudogracilibacillus sp.]|nr:GTPase Era [Pseudogracilibacillus sp.]
MNKDYRSGFVTMIGRPNVGKSTLLNQIIGEKISIISNKIQTTRNPIQGIYTKEDTQIIFIDTPGVHKPRTKLGDYMVESSIQTLQDVDVVLFMVNADEGYGKGDQFILDKLIQLQHQHVFLLINKVDLIHPDEVFALIETYTEKVNFDEVIPISALNGNNVPTLVNLLREYLPAGPQFYGDDEITNRSLRFMLSELIREKVLFYTEEEIPHSINVMIESMERRDNKKTHIQSLIVTERSSQKGILIGKQGQMLKRIGREARKDIEELLGEKVYLDIWVKVQKDWRNRTDLLHDYGFSDKE